MDGRHLDRISEDDNDSNHMVCIGNIPICLLAHFEIPWDCLLNLHVITGRKVTALSGIDRC